MRGLIEVESLVHIDIDHLDMSACSIISYTIKQLLQPLPFAVGNFSMRLD